MKTLFKLFTFAIFTIILAASCAPNNYYQIGEIKPVGNNIQINENNNLVYADENISISYSFWASYGNVYFSITNLTNEDITIHLDNSYFIRNGIAYDYFQNRTYVSTNTSSSILTKGAALSSLNHYFISYPYTYSGTFTASNGVSSSSSNSVQYKEVPTLVIPAQTTKTINQFNVTDNMYRDCNLFLWQSTISKKQAQNRLLYMGTPKGEEIEKNDNTKIENKLIFDIHNSPITFENRIVYSINNSNERKEIHNKFYIESIQNISESKMGEYKYQKTCEDEIDEYIYINNMQAPNKYYIKYNSSQFKTSTKH